MDSIALSEVLVKDTDGTWFFLHVPRAVRLFRDWLREHEADRDLYAAAKLEASVDAVAAGEHVQDYNLRKEAVLREIYGHVFAEIRGR